MLVWTFATAWGAEVQCFEPVREAELADAIAAAEQAWIDIEDALFRDRVAEIAGVLLPCVADAVTAELAARTHVVMALHLSSIGDDANAALSMIAARAAWPELVVSEELIAPAHPLRAVLDAPLDPSATRRVPEPREGSIAFDGTHARERPREHPTIAQLFDETGLARTTTYLAPREPLPPYRALPRQRTRLVACAAGATALAGGAYAWSWAQRGALLSRAADPTTSADALDATRASMNTLALLSTAILGGAATCGVGAAVVGER